MRKLDNGEFLLSIGTGVGGAVGLTVFALALNPLEALQGFLATFGIVTVGGFSITAFEQFSIRGHEAEVRKEEDLNRKMALIQRASSIDINTSRLNRLEVKVNEKLNSLEDKANKTIEDVESIEEYNDRIEEEARKYTDDRPT